MDKRKDRYKYGFSSKGRQGGIMYVSMKVILSKK